MNSKSELAREVHAMIGSEKVRRYEVTERDIKRFAQSIGENALLVEDDGSLVAPALFCQAFMFEDVPIEELPPDGSPKELDVPIPAQRTVGGGSDFEIFGAVRAGDAITVKSKLKDVSVKQGKSGTLYLVVVETSFQNQHGEQVARETATYVKRMA